MKREIKFRAWDNDNESFSYFDFADLRKLCEELDSFESYFSSNYFNEVDEETGNPLLMQFTCLTDKNGKEIYEGDVVKWSVWKLGSHCEKLSTKKINAVGWSDKKSKFFIGSELWDLGTYCDIEIIGNIYETPELL